MGAAAAGWVQLGHGKFRLGVAMVVATMAMDIVGALHDGGGNRVVLAVGLDDWSAYDVGTDGRLGDGRTVQYFVARAGDRLPDALAPACD